MVLQNKELFHTKHCDAINLIKSTAVLTCITGSTTIVHRERHVKTATLSYVLLIATKAINSKSMSSAGEIKSRSALIDVQKKNDDLEARLKEAEDKNLYLEAYSRREHCTRN